MDGFYIQDCLAKLKEVGETMMSRYESFASPSPVSTMADGVYIYYEQFPAGSTKLAAQNLTKSYTPRDQTDPVQYFKRNTKVRLPNIIKENNALPTRTKRNCSFVNNHKTYLRMRGFKLSDVYSVNRHAAIKTNPENSTVSSPRDSTVPDTKTINLPSLFGPNSSQKRKKRKDHDNVWKPSDSKTFKNRDSMSLTHRRSIKELDDEICIPGHLPRELTSDHRLGKVLTADRLNQILTEDPPVIPQAFYISSPGIRSPRNEKY